MQLNIFSPKSFKSIENIVYSRIKDLENLSIVFFFVVLIFGLFILTGG